MKITEVLDSKAFEQMTYALCIYSVLFLCVYSIQITTNKYLEEKYIISSISSEEPLQDQSVEILDINTYSENTSVIQSNNSSSETSDIQKDLTVDIPMPELNLIEEADITNAYTNTDLDSTVQSFSNTTSGESSITGVLDRLTSEIIHNAQNKDLNVIWLFDASVSLYNQRQDIKNRFDKISEELKFSASSTKDIFHTIAYFGEKLIVVSDEPSKNYKNHIDNISAIPIDESGIENVFSSVNKLCSDYKSYNNMIIVFTDEIGDDVNYLEKCIINARQNRATIYVVGPPAPFGSSKIQFKYIDPDPKYDQKERWVEIQQGPESLFKTTLDIQTLPVDQIGLDSGFGPYALTRLCNNTGGTYFAVHLNRKNGLIKKQEIEPLSSYISVFFDSDVMKSYQPDYKNMLAQQNEIKNNKIKAAIVQACQIPIQIIYDQKMNFTAFSEGDFANQLSEAQNFSAKIEPKIEKIYSILKSVESLSKNLDDKRWLASYNLAMGRILATKCRVELYNSMLAEAKSGLVKKDKNTNSWILEYDTEFSSNNSQLLKIYKSATSYLENIVKNYPNTPWAYVANEELNTPMGYKWVEKHIDPPSNNNGNNNNNNPLPKDDVMKKLDYKPQRKTDKI